MFYFWIDGRDMRIVSNRRELVKQSTQRPLLFQIEVDGTDIEETPVKMLSVTVAQRYSILVTARNDSNSNWAIHANMDTDMFDTVPPALNPSTWITLFSLAQLINGEPFRHHLFNYILIFSFVNQRNSRRIHDGR